MERDRADIVNLAARYPERVRQMQSQYNTYTSSQDVLPWDEVIIRSGSWF